MEKRVVMKKNNETFTGHRTRLKPGDEAPNFIGKDQKGREQSLSSFSGKTLVLYFYPKDDTEACTATACSLRDEYTNMGSEGYAIVGVSADDEGSHAKFAGKYNLPFPLIADVDMKIIHDYDVWGQKMLFGRIFDGIVRTTFIISPDGLIRNVINNVDTKKHAKQILELK